MGEGAALMCEGVSVCAGATGADAGAIWRLTSSDAGISLVTWLWRLTLASATAACAVSDSFFAACSGEVATTGEVGI